MAKRSSTKSKPASTVKKGRRSGSNKKRKIRTIAVLTGGGDCPGLNAVIRAVTKSAIYEHNLEVFGIEDGYLGLIENRMHRLHPEDVSNILTVGGTILGTSNVANPFRYPIRLHGKTYMEDVSDRCIRNLERMCIDVLIAIGGDGTMTVADGLTKKGVAVIGVPKTIDNDIEGTELTFGFNTAVRTATEAIDKIHTTASSHHRVMIVEVMGRYAGWIALHAGVASGADIILIPEIPYELDAICEAVKSRSRHGKRFSIIVVAEGAHPKGGKMVVARRIKDSPDPLRLGGISARLVEDISSATGLECRATVLGHVQRGGTPTPFDRVLATQFGHEALKLAIAGHRNRLVVYTKGAISSVPLSVPAGKNRLVPKNHPLIQAARSIGTSFGV